MANDLGIQGGMELSYAQGKTLYGTGATDSSGEAKNAGRANTYGRVELSQRWADTNSSSIYLQNASERLVVSNTIGTNLVGVNFNRIEAAVANGSASATSFNVPAGSSVPFPMIGVRNINIVTNSGSALVSVANYY